MCLEIPPLPILRVKFCSYHRVKDNVDQKVPKNGGLAEVEWEHCVQNWNFLNKIGLKKRKYNP